MSIFISRERIIKWNDICTMNKGTLVCIYRRFIAGPTLNNSKKKLIFLEIIT